METKSYVEEEYNSEKHRNAMTGRMTLTWKQVQEEDRTRYEDDPTFEFSNVACTHLSDETLIISYFTSKMLEHNHPGKLGRERMSLKAAKTTVEWLYKD